MVSIREMTNQDIVQVSEMMCSCYCWLGKQNGFTAGINWMRLVTDIPTTAGELLKGRMRFSDYFNSFKGKKEFAVWSIHDPMPFIAELLMIP